MTPDDLRTMADHFYSPALDRRGVPRALREAASRIEWLEKVVEQLESIVACSKAAVDYYGFQSDYQDPMHQLAAALQGLESADGT